MKISNRNSLVTALTAFSLLALAGPVVALAAGPGAVSLGTAANFAILAKTGISSTGPTSIVGDIGVSPAAATYITGFGLILPAAAAFSTSAIVTGKVYSPDYANPTPATMTTAVGDMATAYTDAAGRTNPTATELGAGNIGGLTIAPGLYKWGTSVTIPTAVTLSGSANDVWIFQVAGTLTLSAATNVVLAGGAQASNIFWVVAGQTTIGTTAVFNGNILDQTAIVLNTGARLNGRALAQTAVTLDSNTVTAPTVSAPMPTPTPTPTTTSGSSSSSQSGTLTSTSGSSGSGYSYDAQVSALQNQVVGLSAILQTLQAQKYPQQSSRQGSAASIRMVAGNLVKGSSGTDVSVLQQFLIAQNKGASAQALANVGATSNFGSLTRSALAEFQAKVGISPASGNFGPITRAYVSAHY